MKVCSELLNSGAKYSLLLTFHFYRLVVYKMSSLLLNHIALLKISGADATDFLQGQLTNDVTLLTQNWHYSGYCSPKGRLLGLFSIWRHDENYYALLSSSLVASVTSRLKMFVLRSKVVVEHLDSAVNVGILGDRGQLPLKTGETIEVATQERGQLYSASGLFILGLGGRSLVIDPLGTELSRDLASDIEHEWWFQNIIAGLPSIDSETVEMFVPQMVNLDLIDGVNFKKGCYTGQEIVARMHYLGKLKQRMFVCDAKDLQTSIESALPGTKILTKDGKNAGNLVTPIIRGKCLAVLRLEYSEAPLQLEGEAAVLTAIEEQPYPLQPTEKA